MRSIYWGRHQSRQLLDTLPVCQDFNKSMCSRLNCRFVHLSEDDKVEVCEQRVAVCRDHANGQCKRKQCKYYHIPIALPPANVMAALMHGHVSNNNNNNNSNNIITTTTTTTTINNCNASPILSGSSNGHLYLSNSDVQHPMSSIDPYLDNTNLTTFDQSNTQHYEPFTSSANSLADELSYGQLAQTFANNGSSQISTNIYNPYVHHLQQQQQQQQPEQPPPPAYSPSASSSTSSASSAYSEAVSPSLSSATTHSTNSAATLPTHYHSFTAFSTPATSAFLNASPAMTFAIAAQASGAALLLGGSHPHHSLPTPLQGPTILTAPAAAALTAMASAPPTALTAHPATTTFLYPATPQAYY